MRNTNMADQQKTLACLMFLDFKYKYERNFNTKKKEKKS